MEMLSQAGFAVNKAGVDFISFLQKSYPKGDSFFEFITETANPLYAFTLFFPIFSALSPHLAAKVLTTAMLSEWINALLKWLLMGHRPFWWVREIMEQMKPLRTPKLRQSHLTCETGPGNPSGHVMSFASIFLVLIFAILPRLAKSKSTLMQKYIPIFLWISYAVSLILISLSRLYIAAHFPHQCLLGAVIGIGLGYLIEKSSLQWLNQWSRRKLLKVAGLIWAGAFGGYWLQRLVGVDPQWSVKLAFKWCNSPENVHVSTTPIFSLTRDCGAALGLALALTKIPLPRKATSKADTILTSVVQALGVASILWLAHVAHLAIPTKDARLYYVCIMLLNAAMPLLLLVTGPRVTYSIANVLFSKVHKKNK